MYCDCVETTRPEPRRDRQELRVAMQLYSALVEKALVGVYITTLDGRILYANHAACRMLGFDDPQELASQGAEALYRRPRQRAQLLELLRRRGQVIGHEIEVTTKQGERRQFSVNATLLEDRVVGMLIDVTEQRSAEAEVETIKAQLDYVLGVTQTGFDVIDEDYHLVYVDPQWSALLGDFSGKKCHEYFMDRKAPCEACGIPQALETGNTFIREQYLEKENRVIEVHTIPLKETMHRKRLVAEFNIDITGRKDIEHRLKQSYARMQKLFNEVVNALASAVELRDPHTAGHQRRVTELALAIAGRLGLTEEEQTGLRIASLLHDVGKIDVAAEILSKPARLSPLEMSMVQVHPEAGYNVLRKIDFPWPVAEIVYQHHERLDGSGYPRGLKQDAILIEARILAVADVVEAMDSHRPYRPALGRDKAMEEIQDKRGDLYDPRVVDVCKRLFAEGFDFSPAGWRES